MEPIMGASCHRLSLRISAVRSPEGPLFRRVDAPHRCLMGICPPVTRWAADAPWIESCDVIPEAAVG